VRSQPFHGMGYPRMNAQLRPQTARDTDKRGLWMGSPVYGATCGVDRITIELPVRVCGAWCVVSVCDAVILRGKKL
jgi:hypothetical protein